jgi:putative membrane protein
MSTAFSFVLHLLGAVLWTGGLLALSRVLMAMTRLPAAQRPGLLYIAGRLNILALLGAGLSLPSGLYQLSLWPDGSFRHAGWLHAKITLIVGLVVVHGLCWNKLKQWRTAGEQTALPRGAAAAMHGVIGLVLIGVLLAVYLGKPHFLRTANFL